MYEIVLCEIISVNPDCFDVVLFGNDCHGDPLGIDHVGNTLDNDCLCNPTDCLGNPLENVLEYDCLGNPMEIIVVVNPWKMVVLVTHLTVNGVQTLDPHCSWSVLSTFP